MKAIAKGDICPRKVSALRDFPPGCGRGAAFVSREEYNKVDEEDPQEDEDELGDELSTKQGLTPILNIEVKKAKKDDLKLSYIWHCRLGHINETRLTKLHKQGYIDPFNYESYGTCECCLLGKMTKSPFTKKSERAGVLLGLVHSDVCGPMNTSARGGYSYFITFTDDHSRYVQKYKAEVEKQTGKSILTLRSDKGGEYLSQEFQDYLKENEILPQWTPPRTPQHNGVSERRNRTLLDMVRSMMTRGYALETIARILNQVPTKSVDKIPYEIWSGKRLNLSYARIWGCTAYVKRTMSDKLEARSEKCKFVGYPKETHEYYFYNPIEQKVFVSRHATFLEKVLLNERASGSKVVLEEVRDLQIDIPLELEPEIVTSDIQPQSQEAQPLKRSSRILQALKRYGFLLERNALPINDEPTTYEEAMLDIDSKKWLEAMKSEMDAMDTNQVWTLVDPPERMKPIRCKWVFKRKIDVDGKVQTFKARLVAKGYKQRQGLSQSTYINKVLKRFSMMESKKGHLPMSQSIYLSKDMCPKNQEEKDRMDKIPYASAIRSIMYAMLCTRPDVKYPIL
ncbi:Integrase [Theobroma cacao]|nr:Integrase [Theobroma cacao]